ncbi:AAA family ATPase [uncultured Clostridium sp.]|uniref:AAA family ATPase n=1 Tax=uncultured Clostridium sp. TaxID=59620 RepID=UPI00261EA694|nr:AAA family ATPase [uncultured Clostridium sp.]
MQLISITMNKFRQYYNKQKIEFAIGNKNITIVFGENGKGKTGIFRALVFGIFGDRYINQDNKNDDIHLVNFNRLEESKGSPVEAWVEVKFKHKDIEYIIKRIIVGYRINNKIIEEEKDVYLAIKDEVGNYRVKDQMTIEEKNKIINSIFDSKIKDFFLFDAEKIDTLAKTNKESKKEVEEGIKNLLKIDKLQKAIIITNDLVREERKNISNRSNDIKVVECEEKIKGLEEAIRDCEEKIDRKKNDSAACTEEINRIEKKLRENEKIKLIQDKISEKKSFKLNKIDFLKLEKQGLQEKSFSKCHMFLMDPYYEMAKSYLNQIAIKQKDLIPLEVIEKSLNDKICSCCKVNLEKNIEAYNEILKLKENFKRSELTPLISNITNSISEFLQEKENELKSIKSKLKKIRILKDEIDDVQNEIEEYEQKIKTMSNASVNLQELENAKKRNEANKIEIQEEIRSLELKKENLVDALKDTNKKYHRVISANKELQFDKRKLEYIEKLKISLEEILNGYSDSMRKQLMNETTNIFKKLIDRRDKDLINNILINTKYEIEVINRLGTIITQDISQGQRQIVALSFITALAKVAGGSGQEIDFPLFMDTPFGRVSGNNRDNLIENIPQLANQWILLLTDTEFTINEEKKIKEIGKLGKWYRLNQKSDGHSEIEEVSLDETLATRG